MQAAANAGPHPPGDRRLEQVARIVSNPVLQNSESLCNLLKYLARQSIDAPAAPVKEYQIATEVFGRAADFDPRLDSTVRVQMSRLRSKLMEYYSQAGSKDSIVIEIPKGSHAVWFRERDAETQERGIEVPRIVAPALSGERMWKRVAAGLLAIVLGLVTLLLARPASHPVAASALPADAAAIFWRGFLQSPQEPLVVFSNAEFVGRPETGLRYFQPGKDAADSVFDHYTGVGEVLSIHELDTLFARLNRPLQLKRGRLLNWDDAKDRDVIFLGSPAENLSLRELSLSREFRFDSAKEGLRAGDLGIVNVHPAAGEPEMFFGSRGLPTTEDYAVVELAPGPAQAKILLLAGTTTFGTQGAVDFFCDPDRLRDLLPKLRGAAGGLAPFSALLRIKINRGVPVEGELVALRRK